MTCAPHEVAESYSECRRVSRCAGSNFVLGFRLLRAEKRRAMEALYAFMRYTDDLADTPTPIPIAGGLPTPDADRPATLTAWRAAVERALAGESAGDAERLHGAALLPALANTAGRFQIPAEHLLAVIDGVAMDLAPRQYATFADLRPYCERVASAVGLACIHVWGFRGAEALPAAVHAGIAMQLTNILRDLREDAQAGRLYVPLEDLRLCNYAFADLRAAVDDERFRRLLELEIARAEQFYRAGSELMPWLERDGRRIFGFMMSAYFALLQEIKRQPAAVLHGRVSVGRWRRLRLAARWALLPLRRLHLPGCELV